MLLEKQMFLGPNRVNKKTRMNTTNQDPRYNSDLGSNMFFFSRVLGNSYIQGFSWRYICIYILVDKKVLISIVYFRNYRIPGT